MFVFIGSEVRIKQLNFYLHKGLNLQALCLK